MYAVWEYNIGRGQKIDSNVGDREVSLFQLNHAIKRILIYLYVYREAISAKTSTNANNGTEKSEERKVSVFVTIIVSLLLCCVIQKRKLS